MIFKLAAHHTSTTFGDGEISGLMLSGLIRALKNIRVISDEIAANFAASIESSGWYPMSSFFGLLREVTRHEVDYSPILFQAGFGVAEDWYCNCGGRERVSSAGDFLRMQHGGAGYHIVHRGNPSLIGSVELTELDETAGCATLVCITPYPKEFEQGLFYGGVLLAGDMEFVDVDTREEPHSSHLTKKTITLRFRRKPDAETVFRLDELLSGMSPGQSVVVPASLLEPLAWRLKSLETRYRLDRYFYQQSNLLLSSAANEIHARSEKLGTLAYLDELSGLLNRRAIFERAEILMALGARQSRPTAFIMIDIDHFKSINDRWGHAVGDESIRLIASVLRAHLRDSDLLGRIGGEEFLVVLPDTDVDGALTLAESLRLEVEREAQLRTDSQVLPVTISLGVTVAQGQPGKEADIGGYIKQADAALYRSKRNGRNQVTYFLGFVN